MSKTVIQVEHLNKLYRLGEVGTGTLSHDINRWWHKIRGKQDPYARIGQKNDRTTKAESDYVWALHDINFEVKQGEVLGVIGPNGAGKSTLLKILSKITRPTEGRIKINGRIASLLEVGTGFHPEMTGRENVMMNGAILGMRKKEILRKLDAIVDFAGVERYIDTPVKRYSSGMKVRLGFAVAAHLDPEILIVDEVLAVGDAEFQKKCLGKMKDVSDEEGRTILFVSHNMAAITRLCSRAILMQNGTVYKDGPINELTSLYLNDGKVSNSIELENEFIHFISIDQVRDKLQLVCKFRSEQLLERPIIGFIISDSQGNKIFGSNPVYQKPKEPLRASQRGEIRVEITEPKLLNGTYLLSIYFADGVIGDLAKLENILSFEVTDMVLFDKEPNANVLGPVAPEVDWKFIYND
jgi:lipopolysaccharide transport system ATP-binding protein